MILFQALCITALEKIKTVITKKLFNKRRTIHVVLANIHMESNICETIFLLLILLL